MKKGKNTRSSPPTSLKLRGSKKATTGKERIFLDYAAITPIDPKVEKEMEKVQKKFWANPSSLHTEGEEAKSILEEARVNIARILHCRAGEIFFTSGGTESLNMAILGVIKSANPRPNLGIHRSQRSDLVFALPHIITSTIEHPAVLEPIKSLLKNKEAEVSFIAPNEKGIINPESIKKEIKGNTILVAIQHANNEIGTIQPIQKISEITKEFSSSHNSYFINHKSPLLLVDASQSVLYENVSLEKLGADLLVLDGIKMYGPRGAGILVVKHGVKISPLFFGGGQEGGLRSGTENVAAAVGLAKALEMAAKMKEKESSRLAELRDYAIAKILEEIPNSSLNGDLENRLPNNINICFATPKLSAKAGFQKVDSEFLVIKLDTFGFAVSAASACHTLSSDGGSYVIESIGKSGCSNSSLRITLGRDSKKIHLDKLIVALKNILC